MLDADDRQVLKLIGLLVVAIGVLLPLAAFVLGIAVRLFLWGGWG